LQDGVFAVHADAAHRFVSSILPRNTFDGLELLVQAVKYTRDSSC
jgi:hypothetical protein